MSRIHHPEIGSVDLTRVLHALSDPVRLAMVRQLASSDGALTCGCFTLDLSKATCSHHLKVLREAGLILQEAAGTTRMTTLRKADLDRRFPGLLDAILGAQLTSNLNR